VCITLTPPRGQHHLHLFAQTFYLQKVPNPMRQLNAPVEIVWTLQVGAKPHLDLRYLGAGNRNLVLLNPQGKRIHLLITER
jgi:hypothetical protein